MKGSEFRALREKARLTQRQISEEVGKTVTTVSRWESMEHIPIHAELCIRWITKDLDDGRPLLAPAPTIDPSDAQWLHTALRSPDDLHPDYLGALKKKYPHLFSETT